MSRKVNLFDALKSSYGNKTSENNIKSKGFVKDLSLSNDNEEVWYHPTKKKLLYNVAGTHNLSDVGTDIYLGLGKLKDTNRYKQAKKTLEQAKSKYNPQKTTITGHSLGGTIAQGIRQGNDKLFVLNSGYTIGQKTRSNGNKSHHFRTEGDLVSLLGSGAKNMKTMINPSMKTPFNILQSHDIDNIKAAKIFV